MTELPFIRRAIKLAAVIFLSLGFALYVLTTYASLLLIVAVLVALVIVVALSLYSLLPRAKAHTQSSLEPHKSDQRHTTRPQIQA
jgi:hypothetical protein